MGPEISTRIQAMLRALEEVIIPAIDTKSTRAMEQAYLIMGYLRLIAHQYDKVMPYRQQEIRGYSALLLRLLRIASEYSGSPVVAEAEMLLADVRSFGEVQLPPDSTLRDAVDRLRNLSDRLVADLLEKDVPALTLEVAHIVTECARSEILRERAWVFPAGMDPAPTEVPPIGDLLQSITAESSRSD
jgi:hypothetical protein